MNDRQEGRNNCGVCRGGKTGEEEAPLTAAVMKESGLSPGEERGSASDKRRESERRCRKALE